MNQHPARYILSPLNLSGLRLTVERECAEPAIEDLEAKRRRDEKRVEVVTRYICTACDEEHNFHSDAEDCCKDEPDAEAPGAVLKGACPVCRRQYQDDIEAAADCCLWKDLDAPARWRIAALVEGGQSWTEAIEVVTGQKLNQFN